MKYYLTLDIGGTDMKYGVITNDNTLIYKDIIPTNGHLGGSNVIKQIKDLFNSLSKKYKLEGISISSTGSIDTTTQILSPSISIIDYEKVNFRRDLSDLGVLVTAENDVNSAALCEKDLIENNESMKSIVVITVGTGIGGAIFINNSLHRGFLFTAGEWGKMHISKDKTYEEDCSTLALIRNAKNVYPSINNGIDVFNYYDNKDEKIIEVVESFYNDLAQGIANLIYILNPEHIIIGGGITNRGERFLNELNSHLNDKIWPYFHNKFKITLAKTKNDAGMIGAFNHFKNTYLK